MDCLYLILEKRFLAHPELRCRGRGSASVVASRGPRSTKPRPSRSRRRISCPVRLGTASSAAARALRARAGSHALSPVRLRPGRAAGDALPRQRRTRSPPRLRLSLPMASCSRRSSPSGWRSSCSDRSWGQLLIWSLNVSTRHSMAASEIGRRSLANFPMQANGAEMLRLAHPAWPPRPGSRSRAQSRRTADRSACRPDRDRCRAPTKLSWLRPARVVLADRLIIGADAKIVRWPDRYSDPRGASMWEIIKRLSEDALPQVLRSAG